MVGQPVYSAAMSPPFQPLQLLLVMFAGWINRHQLDVIAYLQEENRVFKERLGGRRIRFTDAERRSLARKAHALGRKVLNELETLVTADTLLSWRRSVCSLAPRRWRSVASTYVVPRYAVRIKLAAHGLRDERLPHSQ